MAATRHQPAHRSTAVIDRSVRTPSRIARWFYDVAGGIAVALGAMSLFGAVSSAANSCRLVFSQSDFTPDPTAMPSGGCEQYVDVLGLATPLLLGGVLVVAAIRYVDFDRSSTLAKALAIPAGVVAGAMPLLAYWQLHSYYRLAYGPVELAFFGLGLAIVALGLVAAYRTAQVIRGSTPLLRSA
jgi:hypothetical protein